ncbi:LysR substrate-binding domain-containing protein [Xylophilus sp. GOD-11R]|uniref:LysR substrate-binding domain-containing protein n=1 Tax=Xylophilus sp. GOD-11R TaxID=3089814 RepID=UPI00298D4D6C|nr:LysR substrate-binding domain-containing protein [Xylophilus sp. GOD-11R]WPB56918.1 LysR substrate-binding domain-containing protein [Xylophilus sp. GOD-11R]
MSLRRLQPPLQLLRAFSTVVRFGGVSRAAEALHLTQSAVSKQVQELERWVGVALFERTRKRLALTPAGERYEQAVRALLAQLEAATLELITSGDEGGALHLSTLPTFGAKWLIPRLPAFQQSEPQVTLHFVPFVHGYDFQRPELDCSILFGDGHWPGARSHYLAGQDVALIAPKAGLGEGPVRSVRDVARCTLLRHVTVPDAWQRWGETHGVTGFDPLAGPQFDQFQTMIRAVTVGMGVALVPRCLVQDEISAGVVDEPLADGGYRSTLGYWFCYPEARARLGPLVRFRSWLLPLAEGAPTPVTPTAPASAG